MGSSRLSLKRSLLLVTLIALCIFATAVRAQNNNNDNSDTANNNNEPNTPQDNNTENPNNNNNNDNQDATTTEQVNQPTPTDEADNPPEITSTDLPEIISEETTSTPAPRITGTFAPDTDGAPSDLPTLTGIYNTFSYPPPTVPPTENAPFMQKSSLPDGTVFIAVGATLGAFGAAVLIWRGIVACLLHRSVERAAVAQHAANDKAAFPAPPAQFYKYSDQESKVSLTAARRSTRGPIPSSTPSQTNLFFSPTAPGGAGQQSRDSRASFLPKGFYPAGGSTSPQTGIVRQHSISLTNLRPSSRGQVASMVGPSVPESPSIGPNRSNAGLRNMSTSSLNRPPSQRTPSAYLEDLLHENPQALPPQGSVHHVPPSLTHPQGRI